MASSSSSTTISASNSRVTVSLPAPRAPLESYVPGDTLRPSVTFQGSPDYSSVSLVLKGVFRLGLEKWEVGDLKGAFAAAQAPTPHVVTFLELPIPLVSSSQAAQEVTEKEKGLQSAKRDGEGMYELELPDTLGQPGDILPSWAMGIRDHLEGLPAAVHIIYSIEFVGSRSGRFKSDDSLALNVPISIPSRELANTPESDWPSSEVTGNLKYQGNSAPPVLSARLRHHPLSTAEEPLLFHLSVTSSDPSITLHNSSFHLSISIMRKIDTLDPTPKAAEREKKWAPMYLRDKPTASVMEGGEKEVKWEGLVVVPKINKTVESTQVKIKYALKVQITSPLLHEYLVVETDLFLPSSEIAVAYGGGEAIPPPYVPPPYEA